jgi:hypothetical protein
MSQIRLLIQLLDEDGLRPLDSVDDGTLVQLLWQKVMPVTESGTNSDYSWFLSSLLYAHTPY